MFAIAKKTRNKIRSDESQFVIMALIPCQELKKAKKISKTERRKKKRKWRRRENGEEEKILILQYYSHESFTRKD